MPVAVRSKGQGLQLLDFCHHRFESRKVHGPSPLVSVVYVGALPGLEASTLRWP